ncbi:helix-turn-helix domain-containing protein [Paraburkholderia terricola]|jgi:transcriptional regulator with XRE-family HTH domain|uniref:Transcriptional regulator, XRE family n=3 Tax=Burkholderiaceae TaxID=119060 RepID=A0A1M6RWF3_9BURK|nr:MULTISPECIES: helix-turn-helix transcriptional regulator [Paraburkholderia]AXE94754.1 XRE family transcriptional regulator [Paraburkholderia terricola]SDO55284.1 transcriptional regulator, XRE family [Paraburkholderia sediminicola]SHK36826.1 transcriptional regulator, XRE family [Paraburkholderia terricola]
MDCQRGLAIIVGMNTLSLAQTAPSTPPTASRTVGDLLREWRQRRRMSQLLLAAEADISTRHLSFVESGRAVPSREMVMHLAERLDVPLRARNALLIAAGYAPLFRERPLTDPQLAAAREAVELVLKGHEPYPALAIDRHWTILAANSALAPLVAGASAELLKPPVNALRLSLHPEGIAASIVNWHAWLEHVLARLQRQIDVSGDDTLSALRDELAGYPAPPGAQAIDPDPAINQIAVPLRLRTPLGLLSFFSTTTVFGTPVDVTLSELAIEAFFPADQQTAAALREFAESQRAQAAP